MSLENKIEQLTLCIVDLNETIGLMSNILLEGEQRYGTPESSTKAVEKKVKKTSKKTDETPIVEDAVVNVSVEDLKAACIKASRSEVPDAKTKVKALLAKYGAKVVKDVSAEDRITIFNLLETNKY